jgi:hypothetical protein
VPTNSARAILCTFKCGGANSLRLCFHWTEKRSAQGAQEVKWLQKRGAKLIRTPTVGAILPPPSVSPLLVSSGYSKMNT